MVGEGTVKFIGATVANHTEQNQSTVQPEINVSYMTVVEYTMPSIMPLRNMPSEQVFRILEIPNFRDSFVRFM